MFHLNSWVEMETGATALAFTPWQQHETELTGGVAKPSKDGPGPNVEINLVFPNVEAAYKVSIPFTPHDSYAKKTFISGWKFNVELLNASCLPCQGGHKTLGLPQTSSQTLLTNISDNTIIVTLHQH